MTQAREPETLIEAVRYFADPDVTLATIVELRWPTGVHCPTCGRVDVRFIPTRRLWECKEKHPRRQFSAKVGTIFEDSPLSLDKWFVAIWSIANCKNGISSYELARAIGVTQKTGWHMLHRIRLAMKTGSFSKLGGEVEADETFIGGLSKNMHKDKREKKITGTGGTDKTIVAGVLERKGGKKSSRVKARVITERSRKALHKVIQDAVAPGAVLFTDELAAYNGLDEQYLHDVIDHAIAYVDGKVHTNGIENFWSLVKRMLKGTYISVEPAHLDAYLDEQVFRFNERKDTDGGRFKSALRGVSGRHLTYAELTAK